MVHPAISAEYQALLQKLDYLPCSASCEKRHAETLATYAQATSELEAPGISCHHGHCFLRHFAVWHDDSHRRSKAWGIFVRVIEFPFFVLLSIPGIILYPHKLDDLWTYWWHQESADILRSMEAVVAHEQTACQCLAIAQGRHIDDDSEDDLLEFPKWFYVSFSPWDNIVKPPYHWNAVNEVTAKQLREAYQQHLEKEQTGTES